MYYQIEFFPKNNNDGFVNKPWPKLFTDTLEEAKTIISKQKADPNYDGHLLLEVKCIDEYRVNK